MKIIAIVAANGVVNLYDLQNIKTTTSLLKKGVFYNPQEGFVAIAEMPATTGESVITFNPELIKWGPAVMGKTAKSAAKGAYFVSKDSKSESYKFLSGSLSEALVKGEHKITYGGFDYWLNFGGGIARRPIRSHTSLI